MVVFTFILMFVRFLVFVSLVMSYKGLGFRV